jgi:hypothetical protein
VRFFASRRACVGELELTQDMVAEVDGVGEALEAERVLCEPRDGQRACDGSERDDHALISHFRRAELGLPVHRLRAAVVGSCSTEDELGISAHHAERDDDMARLEGSRCGLGQDRRVEHEVLAADDGRALLPEQACDVCTREPASEDERAPECLTLLQSARSLSRACAGAA